MPKKRRTHKNRHKKKNNNKWTQSKTETNTSTTDFQIHAAPNISTVSVFSTPQKINDNPPRNDTFNMETPVKRRSLERVSTTKNNDASKGSDVTPVNKRRSLNRHNDLKQHSGIWNVTNLNMLFNSDALNKSDMSIYKKVENNDIKHRSSSSIAKLHSPGKETPLSFTKGTQTDDIEMLLEKSNLSTPRISQKMVTGIELNKLHLDQPANPKLIYNQITKTINDVPLNPYLKDNDLIKVELAAQKSRWQKEASVEEMSFFSPQLFDKKTSSTPIQTQRLLNYIKSKENFEMMTIGRLPGRLDGTPLREATYKTPRSARLREKVLNNSFDVNVLDTARKERENVNLNTPPLMEKVINKEQSNSIKLLGSNKKIKIATPVSRGPIRASPKIGRLSNHSRIFSTNFSYSRFSRRNSSEHSRTPIIRAGVYEKLINKMKRYSKASAKWSAKMMDACTQLGIQIKNSLTSLCTVQNANLAPEYSQQQCKCESYKAEISILNGRICTLCEEMVQLKQQISDYDRRRGDGVDGLKGELEKIKTELSNMTDLRTELISLKEDFRYLKSAPIVSAPSSAPPVPPPPPPPPTLPPPPPPPPPPMPILTQPPLLALTKKAKSTIGMGASADKESRPVISLDEILKVKLKKAADRPSTTPMRRQRLNSTPMMSDDLFRQVKLRTSNRPTAVRNMANLTTASTPGGASTSSSEATNSPTSSLNRLLDNGTEVAGVRNRVPKGEGC
ncbi:uncharacterized protein LOC126750326 isoform X2 [Anthonomus grandis grandis]|uniref:uncharacterized protein LOC126750326 isoform X2 n=1 Tax=Anthonomus grandis grandis TaxID=2921223 RepID=UPI002164F9B7|nr:uncharacterized protein LOC126750326 isoform X2 [Anthonomus grandis grandis]